jgi:hypothetical protein
MSDAQVGKPDGLSDVIGLKIWQLFKYLILMQTGGQKVKDIRNADTHVPDAGPSPTLCGVNGYAV